MAVRVSKRDVAATFPANDIRRLRMQKNDAVMCAFGRESFECQEISLFAKTHGMSSRTISLRRERPIKDHR